MCAVDASVYRASPVPDADTVSTLKIFVVIFFWSVTFNDVKSKYTVSTMSMSLNF